MYFELYKDSRGQFRWRFKSTNGRIIADGSEGYTSEQNALNGIDIIKGYAAGAKIYRTY